MKRLVPALILLILLPFLTLADVGGCPHHGRGCTHGSSCPTVHRQAAERPAAICHTGVEAEQQEKAKTYRCSISSCHGDERLLLDLDMPFIVSMTESMSARVSAPLFQQELQMNEDLSPQDILEPPESPSYS